MKNFFSKAKNGLGKWYRWVKETGGLPHLDIHCRKKHFGSHYGGYTAAVDFLDADSIIYSFGIGKDITFELAIQNRFHSTIHLFDPTPDSILWISKQTLDSSFILHEYGLSDSDGTLSLYPPQDPTHISHTLVQHNQTSSLTIDLPVKNLHTIMTELSNSKINLLKMDIEGAEYQVIANLVNSVIRPDQILLEFHHHFSNIGISRTKLAMASLKEMGYLLFSYSYELEEFSYIHKSVIQ